MINQLPDGITIDSSFQFWATVRKFSTTSGKWFVNQVGPFDAIRKAVLSQQRTNEYNEQKASEWVPPNQYRQKARGTNVNQYRPQPWSLESDGHIHPRVQADNDRMTRSFFGGSYDHEQGSEIQ
jgi:hypothetical protein